VDTLTYVDTHCHLDLIFQKMNSDNDKKAKKGHATNGPAVVDFESWREDVASSENPDAEDYLGAQLEACLTVACSRKAMDAVREILPKPGVFAAFGCHPLSAHEWNDEMASLVKSMVSDATNSVVAVAECGPRLPLRNEGRSRRTRALADDAAEGRPSA
jgi:Mg-dependent DNase